MNDLRDQAIPGQVIGESTFGAFSLRLQDNIAIVSINLAGEAQNIIKTGFVDDISRLFDQLAQTAGLGGVIFTSGKPGSFIAGADIRMLADCSNAAEATALARSGQAFCDRIAAFPVPVVAAIDGVCLGGGLEFALACHGRVCSDDAKTRLGLPEVQLGLLPGSGGTQRLPRLIGPLAALDMMLTGRKLRPMQALQRGLVDDVVPASILLRAARKRLEELRSGSPDKRHKSLLSQLLEGNPLGRTLLFNQARKRTRGKTQGHYPAPERIINCVEYGLQRGISTGLQFEAENFGELSQTPQARQLMQLYFAVTALKKDRGVADTVKPRTIKRIAVLGAGLMGAGIAYVSSARAGVPVRLKDQDSAGLQRGLAYVQRQLEQRRKRRSITAYEATQQRNRITPCTDFSGFQGVDLVIEAVFEDLTLKQQIVRDIEQHCRPDTLFATNTSSIPLARIAESAARPENIVGMHYFSPVEKMPLLEVIAHEHTAPETIATAVAFGQQQGKTVIVVQDSAGFYVNRILAPYIYEAGWLLLEGVPIEVIDRALVQFGFPVGPFTLLDEVGLDVAAKVAPILQDAFGARMQPPSLLEKLIENGRLGKKNGQGFYRYDKKRKKAGRKADRAIYALLGITPKKKNPHAELLAERCVLPLLNEAARCLHEGVISSARDGDIGAIFGIGFPPFRGGPLRYLDSLGVSTAVSRLSHYEQLHGERFAPAQALTQQSSFYALS